MRERVWQYGIAGVALVMCCVAGAEETAPPLQFNRDIRPILSENCFTCHGPDNNARKAKLRLDVAEDGDTYKGAYSVLQPGQPETADLLARVLSTDPDEVMPPPATEKHVKPEQAEILRRWIAEGAPYELHWSYVAPKRPTVPAAAHPWARTPIDAFVLDHAQQAGVELTEQADPVTLVRRLYFDLTGLPPEPEVAAAFVANPTDEAYAALVDKLLASPHYGERMAIDWLDQVRYADTNGFHSDEKRSIWPYRDYVIHAFNTNKPFDVFTKEQLGGDLMPDASREAKVAAAYNRLNQLTAEGGAQPKEYIAIYAADRVRTVSSVWLGSTVACAQCHDHKYDPYSLKDFYRLSAFFADIQEQPVYGSGQRWDPLLELPTEEQSAQLDTLNRRIALLERKLNTPTPRIERAFQTWLTESAPKLARMGAKHWHYVAPESVTAEQGTTFSAQPDASTLATGPLPVDEVYHVTLRPGPGELTGLRLEALRHESFPTGVARGNGNFVLSGVELWLKRDGADAQRLDLTAPEATFEQATWPIANALDTDPKTGWAVEGHVKNEAQAATFALTTPLQLTEGDALELVLRHETGLAGHAIGRFRIAWTSLDKPRVKLPGGIAPDLLYPLMHAAEGVSDPTALDGLRKRFLEDFEDLNDDREALKQARVELDELKKQIPYTMATVATEPRVTRVLARGNWMDESGEVVEPATPAFLPPLPVSGRRANRLDLAEWLVAPENPLTARVFINRLWRNYYGKGLSAVLDDLGSQGRQPANPDLLDWLAVEFRESGWDIKHMVRMMVTSSTYRQSSFPSKSAEEKDPLNLLFTHQTRYRLEAELVRDNALAVSGLLTPAVGGPSFYPYQPDGYYANCNTFGGDLSYPISPGEEQYRRGMYTFWKRSFLHPSMLAFDAPSREECTADRPTSNTPLQALVLLNDPTYVEAARVFAQRIIEQGGATPEERIRFAFERALSRAPLPEEVGLLAQLLDSQRTQYTAAPEEAQAFVSAGQAPLPAAIPVPELAAWTAVARTILNLHEVITRS